MRVGFIILILLIFNHSYGQIERLNNWAYSAYNGISFSTDTPSTWLGGQIGIAEGSATISDTLGNLLFYSNGVTVWDSTHTPMPNGTGLLGHITTTQSALIIPSVGNPNQYYLFTCPEFTSPNLAVSYSIIDMTLNGGKGDVTSAKNIPLMDNSCEKLAATRHGNGNDFWIVAHKFNSADFYSFLVTAAGVDTVPVISTTGSVYSGDIKYKIGEMAISPSGNTIASAISYASFLEIAEFNNSTGKVSCAVQIASWSGLVEGLYGVEFSPDGSKLYGSIGWGTLLQWNLLAGAPSAIAASVYTVEPTPTQHGALQLGIDGRIYHAVAYQTKLACITNPNGLGPACNYVKNFVDGGGFSTYYGLPNFLMSDVCPPIFYKVNLCSTAKCPEGLDSSGPELVFNGDFSLGDTAFTIDYIYGTGGISGLITNDGQYAITNNPTSVHINFDFFYDHTTGSGQMLVVNGDSIPNKNVWCQTVTVTPNTLYLFSAWAATSSYLNPAILQFSINNTNISNAFSLPASGTGWTQYYATWNSGNDTIATICFKNQNSSPQGNDFAIDDISFKRCQCNFQAYAEPSTNICTGDSVQLSSTSNMQNYYWTPISGLSNPNIHNPVAFPDTTTEYTAIITNNDGCTDSAKVFITIDNIEAITTPVKSICRGEFVQLYAFPDSVSYLWYPPTDLNNQFVQNPIASPLTSTSYNVIVTNSTGCSDTASVFIIIEDLPIVNAGPDINMFFGDTVSVLVNTNGTIYWAPSSGISCDTCTMVYAFPDTTSTYYIIATSSSGCINIDTLNITVINSPPNQNDPYLFIPNIFTPNSDGYNDAFEIITNGYSEGYLKIYNRWGQLIYETKDFPLKWDGKIGEKKASDGNYFYQLKLIEGMKEYIGAIRLLSN
ncbi:MAG: gliding motility-associated C-terminal domain-containing protein [Bacteroidia bacterium]